MHRGVVKWFDEIKGYGYIQGENGQEIFVHFTEIVQEKGFRTLVPGTLVEFEIMLGEMGPKALNVRKLPRSIPQRKN
ncbi:MAG: cold shock domain-containing protein [candidate division KSB1 bacterium]|nr:cold shock domain-containing protein [candidate division KSB1 bacterium]MDZ7318136.1 cold shock domain-containing protein [candidate division KSB1 bacterium]MDZ7341842.1 cold shock domain-containing protein [candidate division KSB1 bacterium]